MAFEVGSKGEKLKVLWSNCCRNHVDYNQGMNPMCVIDVQLKSQKGEKREIFGIPVRIVWLWEIGSFSLVNRRIVAKIWTAASRLIVLRFDRRDRASEAPVRSSKWSKWAEISRKSNFGVVCACDSRRQPESSTELEFLLRIRYEGSCEFRAFDIFAIQYNATSTTTTPPPPQPPSPPPLGFGMNILQSEPVGDAIVKEEAGGGSIANLEPKLDVSGIMDHDMEANKENCNPNFGGFRADECTRSEAWDRNFGGGPFNGGKSGSFTIDDRLKPIGEYMKDPEGYMKSVIQMFDYKHFGGPDSPSQNSKPNFESVFGGVNFEKKMSLDANNSSGGQDFVFNSSSKDVPDKNVKGAGQNLNKDGDDVIMGDNSSARVDKEIQGLDDNKVKNAWSSRGPTLADKIKGNTDNKITLKFKEPVILEDGRKVVRFSKEVIQEGAKMNSMQLIGHFVGTSMPFPIVSNILNRMWKRYGLVDVASNYAGYYILKFNNEEGMIFVLENGPWMVSNIPFFVKRWEVGCALGKPELKKLPLWVNLFGVPLEIWNVQGLGELASGIGLPLALDRATEERCIKQAGRVGFARVLVEVSADRSIPDNIKVSAEYKWKPPRCDHCKIFGHTFAKCEMRILSEEEKSEKLKKENQSRPMVDIDDGFQEVGRRNRPIVNQNRQNGTKNWVNQRFGSQKQGGNQGMGGQNLSFVRAGQKEGQGQKPNGGISGNQGNGERVWQVKKPTNQQLGTSGANFERVFEVGQSSGVKKEGFKKDGQGFVGNTQRQQQSGRGSFSTKDVKEASGATKTQEGRSMGRRVEVKGKENSKDVRLETRVVQNAFPTSNSFDVFASGDGHHDEVMNENERVEDWFEEGVGVGKNGSLNDVIWLMQKKAVNYYLEQGFNPPNDVFQSWSKRQINYFKAVQSGDMVLEKDDVPEFMKPPRNEKVASGEGRAD
ncbi:hypothetical protein OSB04_006319 [Centaurea solstitialis]|uniref:DUF4283 domain-containing protein n=1 Tax=Centaurea solstitialis TaxID=347529 RepID=A0AA38TJF8_9ASTR|nr:hypothetical protein OSB04_006319 [Centaurea solstitialis]